MNPGAPAIRAVMIPHRTANAHAVVTTIQPPSFAFDLPRSTPATTPSPSRIRTIVPRNSPWKWVTRSPRRGRRCGPGERNGPAIVPARPAAVIGAASFLRRPPAVDDLDDRVVDVGVRL